MLLQQYVAHAKIITYFYCPNIVSGRGDADVDTEAGARLTCHLLLRLFKTIEVPQPALYSVGKSFLKSYLVPCLVR